MRLFNSWNVPCCDSLVSFTKKYSKDKLQSSTKKLPLTRLATRHTAISPSDTAWSSCSATRPADEEQMVAGRRARATLGTVALARWDLPCSVSESSFWFRSCAALDNLGSCAAGSSTGREVMGRFSLSFLFLSFSANRTLRTNSVCCFLRDCVAEMIV